MENTAKQAPKTLAEANQIIGLLRKEIQQKQWQLEELHQHNSKLIFQLKKLLDSKYGKKSEKVAAGAPTQLTLFSIAEEDNPAEPETTEAKTAEVAAQETITYTRKKRNGHRNRPKDMPVVRIEYQLQDLTCPCGCGKQLHKIGEVVTEQLEMVPAKIFVKQHARFKYAGCANQDKVITARMPAQPIEKSWAGPGLLASVLVDKYDDHLPLHRQSERFARHGIELSRQTLCDWVMQCADRLESLVMAMKPDLLASQKIHTDDTPVPVLEEGSNKTKTGRLWCYIGSSPPCVIYDYTPTREQKWAENFLEKYEGYLQADAYIGYDKIYKTKNITEVACMAHARRKFFEVAKLHNHTGAAVIALNFIKQLYKVEAKIKELASIAKETIIKQGDKSIAKDLPSTTKEAIRKREAKPILKKYKKWLLYQSAMILPKSPLGQAIAYTLNNWIALTRYLGDGVLDIDNNQAERLMRPITVGRKNWLFAGNDRGGVAAATIYSLIETCKLNSINPYDYLSDVLARLPNTLYRDIKSLLPYNWKTDNNT